MATRVSESASRGKRRPYGFRLRRGRSDLKPVSESPIGLKGIVHSGLPFAPKPVPETCRTQAWFVAGHQALVVHCYAEIECLGISHYRSCVPGCLQELAHELVLTDRIGTGQ